MAALPGVAVFGAAARFGSMARGCVTFRFVGLLAVRFVASGVGEVTGGGAGWAGAMGTTDAGAPPVSNGGANGVFSSACEFGSYIDSPGGTRIGDCGTNGAIVPVADELLGVTVLAAPV